MVYFFGCINRIGHYLWQCSGGRYEPIRHDKILPWPVIDGILCPGVDASGYAPLSEQIEGLARLHHRANWTALAWWDRSVDTRGGSNAAIFASGIYDERVIIELGKQWFPHVFERFYYEIRTRETCAAR